eukprot:141653_1
MAYLNTRIRRTNEVISENGWRLTCEMLEGLQCSDTEKYAFIVEDELYLKGGTLAEGWYKLNFNPAVRMKESPFFPYESITEERIIALKMYFVFGSTQRRWRWKQWRDSNTLALPKNEEIHHEEQANRIYHCGDLVIYYRSDNTIWCMDLAFNKYAGAKWWKSDKLKPDNLIVRNLWICPNGVFYGVEMSGEVAHIWE